MDQIKWCRCECVVLCSEAVCAQQTGLVDYPDDEDEEEEEEDTDEEQSPRKRPRLGS